MGRVRLLSGCIRAVEWVSGVRKADADALVEEALRSMRLPQVPLDGLASVVGALGHLLRAVEEEAHLSALGRYATRWDVHRLLSNLLRLKAEEKLAPGILNEPVEAPIFITGVPRSGTTFLHRLMIEDPAAQAPLCWQTIYPYPEVGRPAGEVDGRPRRVDTQLRFFSMLAPDIRSIHPISGRSPQECTEITAHVFQSLRFDTTYEVPSYRQWLREVGHLDAYKFHKTFLQHLQRQFGRRRWVLKSPDHVFALDALRLVYPDARFVFVHRDPLKVIPSVARLTEVLRKPFADWVDRIQIGRQVVDDWIRGCATMVETDRRQLIPTAQFLHVQYSDVIASPLDTLARIYGHFGLDFTADVADRVNRFVKLKPRGGYGVNHYSFEPYGIDPHEIEGQFQDYMSHFGIKTEFRAGGATA